jgi:flagellin-like protein
MNTLRKMRKNAKALSPVVASIILIAVTVAVSIAVAAWMGALVVGQMSTEEAKVTSINWDTVTLTVRNTGTTDILVTEAYVNNDLTVISNIPVDETGVTVPANGVASVTLAFVPATGSNYMFQLKSAQGNTFPYTAYAP